MTPTQFLVLAALAYLAPHMPRVFAVLAGSFVLLCAAILNLTGVIQ